VLDTRAWREVEHPGVEAVDEPPRLLVDPEQGADRLAHVCGLSALEREVAAMVLMGRRDLEIADRLGQSERTAKRYVGKVLGKAGIKNRASLWGVLYRDGLGAMPTAEGERPQASVQASTVRASGGIGSRPVRPRPSVPAPQPTWPVA
jgi:DNA-binding CsgD family transcriptional regulator